MHPGPPRSARRPPYPHRQAPHESPGMASGDVAGSRAPVTCPPHESAVSRGATARHVCPSATPFCGRALRLRVSRQCVDRFCRRFDLGERDSTKPAIPGLQQKNGGERLPTTCGTRTLPAPHHSAGASRSHPQQSACRCRSRAPHQASAPQTPRAENSR